MRDSYVTSEGSGYVKRKEGEIWTEGGKQWTIKNGVKRTVSRVEEYRKELIAPLCCPHCNKTMKHYLDDMMWNISKMCFDCVIMAEHNIMKAGKWEEYQKMKVLANAKSYYKDLEMVLTEFLQGDYSAANVTEDGLVERWANANKEEYREAIESALTSFKENLDNFESKKE